MEVIQTEQDYNRALFDIKTVDNEYELSQLFKKIHEYEDRVYLNKYNKKTDIERMIRDECIGTAGEFFEIFKLENCV